MRGHRGSRGGPLGPLTLLFSPCKVTVGDGSGAKVLRKVAQYQLVVQIDRQKDRRQLVVPVVPPPEDFQPQIELGRRIDRDPPLPGAHAATTAGGADFASATHSATVRVSARRIGSTFVSSSQAAISALGSRSTSAIELATCFRF